MTIKKLGAALVVATTLLLVASPASATKLSTVIEATTDIAADLDLITDAAEAGDTDSLAAACIMLEVDAGVIGEFTRPRRVPRAGWRHLRAGAALYVEAGAACAEGEYDVSGELMLAGAAEIDLATAAIQAAL